MKYSKKFSEVHESTIGSKRKACYYCITKTRKVFTKMPKPLCSFVELCGITELHILIISVILFDVISGLT